MFRQEAMRRASNTKEASLVSTMLKKGSSDEEAAALRVRPRERHEQQAKRRRKPPVSTHERKQAGFIALIREDTQSERTRA